MQENEEIVYSLTKLKNALIRLEEALKIKDSPISVDGTVQRFEFTFELAWKTLKRVLQNDGILVQSPRETLKESFKLEYIDNEIVWLNMLTDRNNMSHTYNEEQSLKVYENIPIYYEAMIKLVQKLGNKI